MLESKINFFIFIKIFKLMTIDPPFSFITFKILTKLIFLIANNHQKKLLFDKEDTELIKEVEKN